MPRKSSSTRRYGPKAQEKVERAMHERKRGELKSGRSGKKVTSRKQAIAIGLSEARQCGSEGSEEARLTATRAGDLTPTPRPRFHRTVERRSAGRRDRSVCG